MMSKRMLGLIGFGCFLCLIPSVGAAAQVNVDCGDGGTGLQLAIDAASAGDTLLVTGRCVENIYIGETKEQITLDGGGTAIIDAPNPTGHAITAMGRSITIQRFTIRGGFDGVQTSGWPPPGGGAKIYIDNNVVENNYRIGINIGQNSYAVITNNTVQNNSSYGITVSELSSARIGIVSIGEASAHPNIIRGNGGDGIRVTRNAYAVIVGNTIRQNTGNGIYVSKVSHADIASNIIDDNDDCGIYVTQNSGVLLGNDTGGTLFDMPNDTTAKNAQWGIKATVGGSVDGRRGSLKGVKGVVSVGSGGINHTIP